MIKIIKNGIRSAGHRPNPHNLVYFAGILGSFLFSAINKMNTDDAVQSAPSTKAVTESVTPAMDMLPAPSVGNAGAGGGAVDGAGAASETAATLMDTTPVTPLNSDDGNGSVPAYDLPTPVNVGGQRIGACFEYVWKTEENYIKLLLQMPGREVVVHPSNAFQVLKVALGVAVNDDAVRKARKRVVEAISRWIVHEYAPTVVEFDAAAHFVHVFSVALVRVGMTCERAVQWAVDSAQFQANATGANAAEARALAEAAVRSPWPRPLFAVVVEVYMQLISLHVDAYCDACKAEIILRREALTDVLTREQVRRLGNRKTARLSAIAAQRRTAAFISLVYFLVEYIFPSH